MAFMRGQPLVTKLAFMAQYIVFPGSIAASLVYTYGPSLVYTYGPYGSSSSKDTESSK